MSDSSVYEDLQDRDHLKRFMQTQLEDYNDTPGLVPMNLVLFQDAIEHGAYAHRWHTRLYQCHYQRPDGAAGRPRQ